MRALHPALIRELGVEGPVFLFQMELDRISQSELPAFRPLSKFPWVRRDISIVSDRDIPASEVIQCLRKDLPEAVKDLQLFGLYQGEGIDFRKKVLRSA